MLPSVFRQQWCFCVHSPRGIRAVDVSPHSGEEAQTCPCCLSMKAPIIVALGNSPDPIPMTSLQGTLAVMGGHCPRPGTLAVAPVHVPIQPPEASSSLERSSSFALHGTRGTTALASIPPWSYFCSSEAPSHRSQGCWAPELASSSTR